ncbi:MAG TPA: beta-propeller fold lactonase family protein [Longimicrobiales bacterium]|nr:beta-propeller fold lactonase family protein [Longimicrobiales bacterium]
MIDGWRRAARALLIVLAATAAASCAAPAAQSGGPSGTAAAGNLLYVCNQDDASVSIIDMATNTVVRTVDLQALGFSANAKPHHVAVEPDGSFWYVTLIGDGRIVKLDSSDRMVGQVPFETPGMLALHPTEDLLFVGRSMTAVNPPQRIGILQRSDMILNELPVFFPRPHAIALEPRSSTLYTASLAVNQMAAIKPLDEVVELIDVPGPPHALMQFAVSPDGRTLVVSAELSHQVIVFDITDPMAPRLTDEIDVGPQPFDPIFTPDGRWVYLGNKAANTVTVIDMSTRTVADVIAGPGLAQPHGVATSPDGRYVYVSNNNTGQTHQMSGEQAEHAAPATSSGNGTVVVIDTATREIVSVIEVGRNASGIGTRTYRQ